MFGTFTVPVATASVATVIGRQLARSSKRSKSTQDRAPAQLTDYINVAREQGFDVVLTISNQPVTAPGEHPTAIDRKKLKKVALRHLSWSQIHTEAVIERVNRAVADPDQAWILAELIRYLEHQRSGAVDFDDMGPAWVGVRNSSKDRTFRASDKGAAEVVAKFGQLTAFAGMRLSRSLGVDVQPALTRAQLNNLGTFTQSGVNHLVEHGTLHGSLKVPNAVAPIDIVADLRSGLVTCSVSVPAPSQGRNTTRVNWLTRQLAKAPAAVQLEAVAAWARTAGPCRTLAEVRVRPEVLVDDPKRELRSFNIKLSTVAGTKRGEQRGSFVGSVLALVDSFYEGVVQHIRPWTAPAPSLKTRYDEDGAVEVDRIAGELPLKSVQRTAAAPEWSPPDQATADQDDLIYAIAPDGPTVGTRRPSRHRFGPSIGRRAQPRTSRNRARDQRGECNGILNRHVT